jgi:hypothetical protein
MVITNKAKQIKFCMALRPTQPPIQWVPGAPFPRVKQPEREADHSTPTSAKVKKIWVYTSTPPYVFMAHCLISQAQEQLIFNFSRC